MAQYSSNMHSIFEITRFVWVDFFFASAVAAQCVFHPEYIRWKKWIRQEKLLQFTWRMYLLYFGKYNIQFDIRSDWIQLNLFLWRRCCNLFGTLVQIYYWITWINFIFETGIVVDQQLLLNSLLYFILMSNFYIYVKRYTFGNFNGRNLF